MIQDRRAGISDGKSLQRPMSARLGNLASIIGYRAYVMDCHMLCSLAYSVPCHHMLHTVPIMSENSITSYHKSSMKSHRSSHALPL